MSTPVPIHTPYAPQAIGPYSQAMVVSGHGRMVFCSGQVALDPLTGHMISGEVGAQAHQVMENLRAVLRAAGGDLEHLVKTTIFLQDLSDFAAVNQVYASFLSAPYPARATVQVAKLPKDALVEIDGIAVIP